ncbi:MAG: ABC transporter substrate-binding protein [Chloroflexi bacterium]|nr:ABC transporter substrate-binding protein [Chloroflexota bacterium]
MKHQHLYVALTVALIALLIVVACAPAPTAVPPTSAPTTAAPTTAAPPATSAPQATKAPAPTVAPTIAPAAAPTASAKAPTTGGVLKISTVPDADILGYPPTMTKLNDFYFAATSLETLAKFDDIGAPVPGLASEWKVDVAAKTITLSLQKGVKFHDGSDFNAKVAKWNLDGIRQSKRTELAAVGSIDVVDDNTIRLNLSKYDSSILVTLAGPVGLMISQTAFDKNGGAAWAEKNPIGTGPFKLVSWQRDVKQVYTRFDGYWQKGKPYLDGVEWTIIADPLVRLASFKAGESNVTQNIEPKDAKQLEADSKYRISTLASALYALAPDGSNANSAFAKLPVRQAVDYAIDKQAICETLGYGYWKPLYQAAAPGSWAENPKVMGNKYNPTKAKQLLTDAGYPNGLKTTIYTPNSPQIIVDMLTAVQGYLKAVGIDAKIEAMEQVRYGDVYAGKGWQDGLAMAPMGLSPNEIGLLNRLFLPGSVLLPNALRPAAFQQKLIEVGGAADNDTKQKLTWELQKIGTEDNAMMIWLHTSIGITASQTKVHDHGFSKTIGVPWTPAEAWMDK